MEGGNEHHAWIAQGTAGQSRWTGDGFRHTTAHLARDRRARGASCRAASATLGVNAGDRVAILSLNSDRYLEVYLATGWAGGVVVPLNIRWSQLENEDAMRDCRANVLLVDKAFAPIAVALAKKIDGLTLVYADDGEVPAGMKDYEALLAASDPVPDAMRDGSDLAGIFYTGGTTGRSKGVMLSHTQSDGQCHERAGRGAVRRHGGLSPRRADVSSRQRRCDVFDPAERRLQRDRPELHAGRRDGGVPERAGHQTFCWCRR